MATNDFSLAGKWLHPDFEYYMPQTGEYLCGKSDFIALNENYPTEGRWSFDVQSIVSEGETVVSDVEITDGSFVARALTFHALKDGLIWRQKEYWPEDYPAPEWRSTLVEHLDTAPF